LGFSLEQLADLRPFAYHTSGQENFEAIRRHRRLRSARSILEGTEHEHLLVERRKHSVALEVRGESVLIRDNRPLAVGSLDLQGGWSLSDWLGEINSRVFLWPGSENGPIQRGRAHFGRYASEGPVFVIKVPTPSLFAANQDRELWVTRCNSGSARHIGGKPVPRGPSTFQLPTEASFRASEVIELSYRIEASLPHDALWSTSLAGRWSTL
jgi:hypothetical protein